MGLRLVYQGQDLACNMVNLLDKRPDVTQQEGLLDFSCDSASRLT